MWTELGRTSARNFFTLRPPFHPELPGAGTALVACVHLNDPKESTASIRQLLVKCLNAIQAPDMSTVISVQGPVLHGGLPDVVAAWFAITQDEYRKRFHWPGSERVGDGEGFVESWFSFEGDGIAVERILEPGADLLWGSGMYLGGIQVQKRFVGSALKLDIFDPMAWDTANLAVDIGFYLNNDMNELSVFLGDSCKSIRDNIGDNDP